ncbi:DNA-binding protein [Bacillus thuringiensis serovar shandongiensis]|uniref:DnaD domain protein n=1 Tax=Bacillus toyonensis TaxID=155322 RepID=UPI000B437BF1|nr:DnaD domain protein [Bacillus toyonensis]MEC2390249.1 DnaD domain protein [Bacillus toyonensis]OTX32052.1 DNA-binding protein [Bacillus thuringiensis serovar malayensis]OUB10838.1 DNA-binding protein [Bacillus thuringiensis serovar shandongiensis]
MGIVRVEKTKNYSVVNNTGLRDERLSWKAKGILAYILTLPDDWVFYREELATHAKDGLDSLRSGMKELKEYGYLQRLPIRNDNNKIVSWETVIHEVPQVEPLVGFPPVEEPPVENPPVGNPPVENPELLNTNIPSTNKLNTNIQNTNHHDDDESKSHVLVDEEFKISYNFLKEKGIPLSEIAITELGEFCDLFGSELIKHATNKSIDENAPRWNYIKAILKNWEKQKVKTLDDVAALDRRFEMSKNNKFNRSGTGQSNRKEIVPDWLREDDEPTKKEIERQNSQSTDEECKRLQEVLKQYKT